MEWRNIFLTEFCKFGLHFQVDSGVGNQSWQTSTGKGIGQFVGYNPPGSRRFQADLPASWDWQKYFYEHIYLCIFICIMQTQSKISSIQHHLMLHQYSQFLKTIFNIICLNFESQRKIRKMYKKNPLDFSLIQTLVLKSVITRNIMFTRE